jgi:hypothetical protein
MIYDVAASATALAAGEIAKSRNKLIIYNGPATIALTNEACGLIPYTTPTIPMGRPCDRACGRQVRPRHLVLLTPIMPSDRLKGHHQRC